MTKKDLIASEESDTYRISREPVVLVLEVVHSGIKLVEIPVTKKTIIGKVELPASIVERVAIAFAREVEPLIESINILTFKCQRNESTNLGMSKLVTFEVQVSFASERVDEKAIKKG